MKTTVLAGQGKVTRASIARKAVLLLGLTVGLNFVAPRAQADE